MTTNTTTDYYRCSARECRDLLIHGHGDREAHELVQHGGLHLTRRAEQPATDPTTITATATDRDLARQAQRDADQFYTDLRAEVDEADPAGRDARAFIDELNDGSGDPVRAELQYHMPVVWLPIGDGTVITVGDFYNGPISRAAGWLITRVTEDGGQPVRDGHDGMVFSADPDAEDWDADRAWCAAVRRTASAYELAVYRHENPFGRV